MREIRKGGKIEQTDQTPSTTRGRALNAIQDWAIGVDDGGRSVFWLFGNVKVGDADHSDARREVGPVKRRETLEGVFL